MQSFTIDFSGLNKKLSLLEVSLVYNKSDQHNMIFDSYNIELASTKTKLLKLETASNTYSVFNEAKFDTEDSHDNFYYTISLSRRIVIVVG